MNQPHHDGALDAQHLDEIGRARQGVLIHVDGLPQAELNHLQRTLAVVLEIGSEAQRADAQALLQHLASRAEIVNRAWGSANPNDFAGALRMSREKQADGSAGVIASLALLYRPERFSRYIERWIDDHYRSRPLETWKDIYTRVRARTAR